MSGATSVTVGVPLNIRRRPGRKTMVTPIRDGGDAAIATHFDPAVVKALARSFRYQKLLNEGRYASITEMAAAEKIERGYLGSLLRLTLLAPTLVEELIQARPISAPSPSELLQPFPEIWEHEQELLMPR
ncbi:hypothetical protein [Neoroseomonas lacus]|uniref:Bacteriophage-related protein n=1 Tax=Neoroseomonas lacus TaxID=287609 RepID=A0A917L594_9PROT|nr:hypothetical protein [Neoroseomonas lacus]GGJ43054.1 hypothetical protein GCM10011320_58260 [Neoroseomonas lacus]